MKYEIVDPESNEELVIETRTCDKWKTVITRYRTRAKAGKVKQIEEFYDGKLVSVIPGTDSPSKDKP